MATSKRLAHRPKARPAPPEAAPDRFETFVMALQTDLKRRYDSLPSGAPGEETMHDVYMAVLHAANAARIA